MSTLRSELIRIFALAGDAHHQAFNTADGEDSEWAQWYASHLLNQLGPLLGTWFSHSALARELEELETRRLKKSPPPPWLEFYAEHFIQSYSPEQRRTQ
ncbi:MAG: hypothetical protein HYZ26_10375 [Chloroflexi bacterium]|nr:hypothetical protein [Chloroflexota bacterium]